MTVNSRKKVRVLSLVAVMALSFSHNALSSEKNSSGKSREDRSASLEASASGQLSRVTYNYLDNEQRRMVEKTVDVPKLTADAMIGDFATLKAYAKAINQLKKSNKASLLCEQIAIGIVLAQRFDLLDEIMNDLQEQHDDMLPLQGEYKKFLSYFVKSLWVQLLQPGNEELLKRVHEAHYLPLEVLPDVIDEIVRKYAREAEAQILLEKVVQNYHNFGVEEADKSGPFRKVDVLAMMKLRGLSNVLKAAPDFEITRELLCPANCMMQPLQTMIVRGVSDACIVQCARSAKVSPFTLVEGFNMSTALLLVKNDRFPLLFMLLQTFGSDWLSDREGIVEVLIARKHFVMLEKVLSMEAFCKTKSFQGALMDRVIFSLKSKLIQVNELQAALQAKTQPFLQNLMLRAMQANDSEAMVYLLESDLIDVNQAEFATMSDLRN